MRILWLQPIRGYSDAMSFRIDQYCSCAKLPKGIIFKACVETNSAYKMLRGKPAPLESESQLVRATIDAKIQQINPTIIVVNTPATLLALTGQTSLDACRGSVYSYKGIPCIVFGDFIAHMAMTEGDWIMASDFSKLARWAQGKQRNEPRFAYTVCKTIEQVKEAADYLCSCFLISNDIETTGTMIACEGFTGLKADGSIHSFIIPFHNPLQADGNFWETEEQEMEAWRQVYRILKCEAVKVYQNGSYDNSYHMHYRMPPTNWLLDTLHMQHSMYCETPKKLNFLASIYLDNCKYWKDEGKAAKAGGICHTQDELERYWRYCALDCHNTLLISYVQVILLTHSKDDYALTNYAIEFPLQVGPLALMNMIGLRVDTKRHAAMDASWTKEGEQALQKLRIMTDQPDFSPTSNAQVASLLYDVLGAKPIKIRGVESKTVDEKVLKLVAEQHPILDTFIRAIWDAKKPSANLSKYGIWQWEGKGKGRGLKLWKKEWFLYKLAAAGTETGRLSGKDSDFWCGTNPQNLPSSMKPMLKAPDDWCYCEIDYAQSDFYFVAYESGDEAAIAAINSGMDTHCLHASFFFGIPYETIMAGIKKKDPYFKQLRQGTKRITHGANYMMTGATLYAGLGRETTTEMAKAMGFTDASSWTEKQLIKFCDTQLTRYTTEKYPTLGRWQWDVSKHGNRIKAACGFTRIVLGDMTNGKTQREVAAFFGQGGTAGNINKAMLAIHYKHPELWTDGCIPVLQVHDSLLLMVHRSKLDSIDKVLTIMEEPIILKGRSFRVPTDAKIGLSWGSGMVSYHKGVTWAELEEADSKVEKQLLQ